jgi:hypothetical protein
MLIWYSKSVAGYKAGKTEIVLNQYEAQLSKGNLIKHKIYPFFWGRRLVIVWNQFSKPCKVIAQGKAFPSRGFANGIALLRASHRASEEDEVEVEVE